MQIGLAFPKTTNSVVSRVLLGYLQKQVGNFREIAGYPEEK